MNRDQLYQQTRHQRLYIQLRVLTPTAPEGSRPKPWRANLEPQLFTDDDYSQSMYQISTKPYIESCEHFSSPWKPIFMSLRLDTWQMTCLQAESMVTANGETQKYPWSRVWCDKKLLMRTSGYPCTSTLPEQFMNRVAVNVSTLWLLDNNKLLVADLV